MGKAKFVLLGSVVFLSAVALALDMPLEGLSGGPAKTKLSYNGIFHPWDTSQWQQLSGTIPVMKNETHSLSVSAQDASFKVPETYYLSKRDGLEVPKALRSQQFGLGYSRRLEGERNFSFNGSFGSDSDKPFEGGDVSVFSLTMAYLFPAEDDPSAKWIWLIFYSNNNPVLKDIPIPGVAYFHRSKELVGAYGLPFAFVKWFPEGKGWSATLLAFGGTIWKTELAFGPPFGGANTFLGLDWMQDSWLREGRKESQDKLFYDEKQVHAGYRQPVTSWLSAEAQVGYAFQRRFFEGRSYWDKSSDDADLPDNGFFSLELKVEL